MTYPKYEMYGLKQQGGIYYVYLEGLTNTWFISSKSFHLFLSRLHFKNRHRWIAQNYVSLRRCLCKWYYFYDSRIRFKYLFFRIRRMPRYKYFYSDVWRINTSSLRTFRVLFTIQPYSGAFCFWNLGQINLKK